MAKLLLVEDDNNLREIYEARLTAEGYDIVTAQNGEEALSVAKQHKPDLIISDVMMPRISGFEMLDILRNTDELKNTKVIMLTALGQAEDRGRADNLGADKYLVKSQVTLEDIVNAAKALLADEPGGITTPTPTPLAPPDLVPAAMPAPTLAPVSAVAASSSVATAESANTPAPNAPSPAEVSTIPAITVPQITPPAPLAPTIPAPAPTPTSDTATVAATPVVTPLDSTSPATTTPAVADATVPLPDAAVPASTEPIHTTVTVTDPDPITPHISPAAEPLSPDEAAALSEANDVVEPSYEAQPTVVPNATETVPEPPAPATIPPTNLEPQTLAAEEAAIEAQIASFVTSPEAMSPPTATETANDAVLDDAMSKLTANEATEVETDQPTQETSVAEPSPEPTEATPLEAEPEQPTEPSEPDQPVELDDSAELDDSVEPVEPVDTTSQISGRKVIQPIDDIEAGTPDLEALLAKEEAKEAAYAKANPKPTAINADGTPGQDDGASAVDPNTIAL